MINKAVNIEIANNEIAIKDVNLEVIINVIITEVIANKHSNQCKTHNLLLQIIKNNIIHKYKNKFTIKY